jgi:predicted dehydrogenase/threonine dehydrogenase-like Zn-dependent dehydrogenase
MRQLLQDLRTGELLTQEVPVPQVRPGHLLIRTQWSLISSGTERMLVNFGKAGYLSKARQQPERVRQVIQKLRTDGLLPTMESVQARLNQPLPLGYCNVGVVSGVGDGVSGFVKGDIVANNGPHAEVVLVPRNLCAKVPRGVDGQAAAFTVVGAIGLQGVRLIRPTLGESIVVFGLGLVGLLASQLLKASGTRVIGFDYDGQRVELAQQLGIEARNLSSGVEPVAAATSFTQGRGADGVLITASTPTHDLIRQAAKMSRQRGRLVLTGVVGLNLDRADFYEKELSFQVSCSYGPGRYDPSYEDRGHDYPLGFVRWTEGRNFEAVLDAIANERISVKPLISKIFPFEEAAIAYDSLRKKAGVGLILRYSAAESSAAASTVVQHRPPKAIGKGPVVGVIGAGSFTQAKTLPILSAQDCALSWIASAQGTTASIAARRFKIRASTTEPERILEDPDVDAVFVTTRHDSHASYVVAALSAGKHVYVEKPLCISRAQLDEVQRAYDESRSLASPPLLMVGFNRRFSPLAQSLYRGVQTRSQPLCLQFTCNAGFIPADHWVHDPAIGGGRIIGEACHFVDLLQSLCDAPITTVDAIKLGKDDHIEHEDSVSISLSLADGSIGSVNYFSTGAKRFPKERLLVFGDQKVYDLDNFRRLSVYGDVPFRSQRLFVQNKGHKECIETFLRAIRDGNQAPLPFTALVNTTLTTFSAVDSMRGAGRVKVSTRL